MDGVTALSSHAGTRLCGALSVSCTAAAATFFGAYTPTHPCFGKVAGTVVRGYMNASSVDVTSGADYAGPNWPLADFSFCNTPGCNAPARDACALVTAPIVASVSFAGLPAAALDSSGKLTAAAVTTITTAIKSAVASTGCPLCTVTLKSIVDEKGVSLLPASTLRSRRLQAMSGGVTVTFETLGGTPAAVASATSGTAFAEAATAAIAAAPGYSGVTARAPTAAAQPAAPSIIPLAVGVAVGAFVLIAAAAAACCLRSASSKKAAAAKVVAPPPARA